MALKHAGSENGSMGVTILNKTELLYAMGGLDDSPCPMLTSCGTYSPECNDKCAVKGITVGI